MAIVHLAFYTLSQYYIKMYAQTYGFHLESSVRGGNGRGNHMCSVATSFMLGNVSFMRESLLVNMISSP